jgi:hypothetical protein
LRGLRWLAVWLAGRVGATVLTPAKTSLSGGSRDFRAWGVWGGCALLMLGSGCRSGSPAEWTMYNLAGGQGMTGGQGMFVNSSTGGNGSDPIFQQGWQTGYSDGRASFAAAWVQREAASEANNLASKRAEALERWQAGYHAGFESASKESGRSETHSALFAVEPPIPGAAVSTTEPSTLAPREDCPSRESITSRDVANPEPSVPELYSAPTASASAPAFNSAELGATASQPSEIRNAVPAGVASKVDARGKSDWLSPTSVDDWESEAASDSAPSWTDPPLGLESPQFGQAIGNLERALKTHSDPITNSNSPALVQPVNVPSGTLAPAEPSEAADMAPDFPAPVNGDAGQTRPDSNSVLDDDIAESAPRRFESPPIPSVLVVPKRELGQVLPATSFSRSAAPQDRTEESQLGAGRMITASAGIFAQGQSIENPYFTAAAAQPAADAADGTHRGQANTEDSPQLATENVPAGISDHDFHRLGTRDSAASAAGRVVQVQHFPDVGTEADSPLFNAWVDADPVAPRTDSDNLDVNQAASSGSGMPIVGGGVAKFEALANASLEARNPVDLPKRLPLRKRSLGRSV